MSVVRGYSPRPPGLGSIFRDSALVLVTPGRFSFATSQIIKDKAKVLKKQAYLNFFLDYVHSILL